MPFPNEKKLYLQKQDQSKKGEIDQQVLPLLKLINAHDDYYTTSSCAGRVYLWRGAGKKNEVEWIKVSHELVGEDFFELEAWRAPNPSDTIDVNINLRRGMPPTGRRRTQKRQTKSEAVLSTLEKADALHFPTTEIIWLRLEPFILHIACKDLAAANHLVELARKIYKKSCILTISNKIMVEIRGSELIEMPLYRQGRLLYQGELSWLVTMINHRLEQMALGREKLVKVLERGGN